MGRIITERAGYRLRDLVACGVVLQLGTAFIYALNQGPQDPAMQVAMRLFAAALAVLPAVYLGGATLDLIARRYPALVRPRQCSWKFAVALYGTLLLWAVSEERVREQAVVLARTVAELGVPVVVWIVRFV